MKILYQLTDSIDYFHNGKLMRVEPNGTLPMYRQADA